MIKVIMTQWLPKELKTTEHYHPMSMEQAKEYWTEKLMFQARNIDTGAWDKDKRLWFWMFTHWDTMLEFEEVNYDGKNRTYS